MRLRTKEPAELDCAINFLRRVIRVSRFVRFESACAESKSKTREGSPTDESVIAIHLLRERFHRDIKRSSLNE